MDILSVLGLIKECFPKLGYEINLFLAAAHIIIQCGTHTAIIQFFISSVDRSCIKVKSSCDIFPDVEELVVHNLEDETKKVDKEENSK